MRVAVRVTKYNRCSIPAVLAVLEAETPAGAVELHLTPRRPESSSSDLILYSFASGEAESVALELRELRAAVPDLLAVAGGPHPSARPKEVLQSGFRWVVVGEAGPEFGRLLRALFSGSVPPSGLLVERPSADLDRYPPWPTHNPVFAPLEISRGCPVGCAFCQTPRLFGRRMRHRSPERLVPALVRAVESGHTFTRFISPNAFAYGSSDGRTPSPRSVERLLRCVRDCGMREVFFGTFPSEVRPESVTPELLTLVRDYCQNRTIAVGVQSGSPDLLLRIRRGHTVEQSIAAIAAIAGAGFRAQADFIFGLPGESATDQRLSRELAMHLARDWGARIHAHAFVPIPGTPLSQAVPAPIDSKTRDLISALTGQGNIAGVKRRGAWTRVATKKETDC